MPGLPIALPLPPLSLHVHAPHFSAPCSPNPGTGCRDPPPQLSLCPGPILHPWRCIQGCTCELWGAWEGGCERAGVRCPWGHAALWAPGLLTVLSVSSPQTWTEGPEFPTSPLRGVPQPHPTPLNLPTKRESEAGKVVSTHSPSNWGHRGREAEAGGSCEPRSGPAWATWRDPSSNKQRRPKENLY